MERVWTQKFRRKITKGKEETLSLDRASEMGEKFRYTGSSQNREEIRRMDMIKGQREDQKVTRKEYKRTKVENRGENKYNE